MLIGLLSIVAASALPAQNTVPYTLRFQPQWGASSLVPGDSVYRLDNGDSVQIEVLRFYISGIELLDKGKTAWGEKNSFHLVDASSDRSLQVALTLPANISFDKIRFTLGVDSTTNVSGALGGDLDPTRGMYWTWQSGYINFKLEGTSRRSTARNNAFQFHFGGYLSPYASVQQVTLPKQNERKTTIGFDVRKWLGSIDLAQQNHVMTPGAEAVQLSKKVSALFTVEPQ